MHFESYESLIRTIDFKIVHVKYVAAQPLAAGCPRSAVDVVVLIDATPAATLSYVIENCPIPQNMNASSRWLMSRSLGLRVPATPTGTVSPVEVASTRDTPAARFPSGRHFRLYLRKTSE